MTDNVSGFNAASQPPYTFIFFKEVEAFYQEHQALMENVFFIDSSRNNNPQLHIIEGQDGRKMAEILMSNKDFQSAYTDSYNKGSCVKAYYNASHDLNYSCLFMNPAREDTGYNILGRGVSTEITKAFVFDHEVAHILSEAWNSSESLNAKEALADAYAVIRHFQRFGSDSGALDRLGDIRALAAVFGDDTHASFVMIDRIIKDKDVIDFSHLSPQKTLELAQQYAALYAPQPGMLQTLAQAYAAFGNETKKWTSLLGNDSSVVSELGTAVLAAGSGMAFDTGARALRVLLDGEIGGKRWQVQPPSDIEATLRQALNERTFQTPKKKPPRHIQL